MPSHMRFLGGSGKYENKRKREYRVRNAKVVPRADSLVHRDKEFGRQT